MDKELKNCPFCGGEPSTFIIGGSTNIMCQCGVSVQTFAQSIDDDTVLQRATEIWNARVEPEKPAEVDESDDEDMIPTLEEIIDLLKCEIYEMLDNTPYDETERRKALKDAVELIRAVIEFDKYC